MLELYCKRAQLEDGMKVSAVRKGDDAGKHTGFQRYMAHESSFGGIM